jgi:IclR family pca regulon transcriptional regulator
MSQVERPERDGDMVAGLAKGLAVIEAFEESRPRLSIAEVARAVGLERATARRCLLTLVKLGYADYDGKFFSLTPRVMRLGHAYLSATPLPRVVQPYLERLSAETGESCSASVLEGGEIVYVARASQRRVMSISLDVGSRLPATTSSMGRVLLAAMPEAEARRLVEASERRALTPNTRTTVEAVMDEVARVRAEGFAINDEELEIGLRSIAVPIFGVDKRVVAALNIGAQALRVSVARMTEEFLPKMRGVQDELRRLLP